MRLFLAIDLPADVRRPVAAKARQLRDRAEGSAPGGFTWVADENLHLTLHFIGHVDEAREAAIRASIGTHLPIAPFEVVLAAAVAFPEHGHPRVIWIGVKAGSEGLRSVHDLLGARLQAAGVAIEARPYSAHLTVARARETRDRRGDGRKRAWREILDTAGDTVGVQWRVDAVTLFESHLSPKGPRYTPRARILLRAPADTDRPPGQKRT